MVINYLGHSSFKIKNKNVIIIISPFDGKIVGYRMPKSEADILLISKDSKEYNNINVIKGDPFIIKSPGEFEIKEVMILGFHTDNEFNNKKNTVFRFEVEDVNFVHLGALNDRLTDEQLERLGEVDILFVPIGGKGTIDAKKAVEIASKIEPTIVIPMYYFDPDFNENFKDLPKVDRFIEIMGSSIPEEVASLKVNSKDFGQAVDGTKIIVLEKK